MADGGRRCRNDEQMGDLGVVLLDTKTSRIFIGKVIWLDKNPQAKRAH